MQCIQPIFSQHTPPYTQIHGVLPLGLIFSYRWISILTCMLVDPPFWVSSEDFHIAVQAGSEARSATSCLPSAPISAGYGGSFMPGQTLTRVFNTFSCSAIVSGAIRHYYTTPESCHPGNIATMVRVTPGAGRCSCPSRFSESSSHFCSPQIGILHGSWTLITCGCFGCVRGSEFTSEGSHRRLTFQGFQSREGTRCVSPFSPLDTWLGLHIFPFRLFQ